MDSLKGLFYNIPEFINFKKSIINQNLVLKFHKALVLNNLSFFSLLEPLEHPLISSSSFFSKHSNTLITAVHDSFVAVGKDASGEYLREEFYCLNLCLKRK